MALGGTRKIKDEFRCVKGNDTKKLNSAEMGIQFKLCKGKGSTGTCDMQEL